MIIRPDHSDFASDRLIDRLSNEFTDAVRHPGNAKTIVEMHCVSAAAFRHCGWIGLAEIETREQYYQPSDEGNLAIILQAHYGEARACNLVDLVAWHPGRPHDWWVRTGIAWGLGMQFADPPFFDDTPVKIFRSPLSWLAAAGQGICLLEHENAWDRIGQIRKIAAEDVVHGRELQTLLEPPVLHRPEIVVPAA